MALLKDRVSLAIRWFRVLYLPATHSDSQVAFSSCQQEYVSARSRGLRHLLGEKVKTVIWTGNVTHPLQHSFFKQDSLTSEKEKGGVSQGKHYRESQSCCQEKGTEEEKAIQPVSQRAQSWPQPIKKDVLGCCNRSKQNSCQGDYKELMLVEKWNLTEE